LGERKELVGKRDDIELTMPPESGGQKKGNILQGKIQVVEG